MPNITVTSRMDQHPWVGAWVSELIPMMNGAVQVEQGQPRITEGGPASIAQ